MEDVRVVMGVGYALRSDVVWERSERAAILAQSIYQMMQLKVPKQKAYFRTGVGLSLKMRRNKGNKIMTRIKEE